MTLADVLTSPIEICGLSDDLKTCADVFATKHLRHLVVVDEGALVGIIGIRDLVGANLGE